MYLSVVVGFGDIEINIGVIVIVFKWFSWYIYRDKIE